MVGMEDAWYNLGGNNPQYAILVSMLRQKLYYLYEEQWSAIINGRLSNNHNKLRSYCKFKNYFTQLHDNFI